MADAQAVRRPRPAAADRNLWLGLGPGDWLEALEGHPRIGERGGSAEEQSRREQAGMGEASEDTRAAIAAGNRRYEDRFGHVFLVSAAGGGRRRSSAS